MKVFVWIAVASLVWYPPRLTITPQPGSKLSDVVEVRVTASEPLKRVEFLLDGRLVGTDTSTPYTWTWDTLSSEDGEQVLTLRAVDASDRVAAVEVRYTIDNELSRGGTFYLNTTREHLAARRWHEAVKSARRAVHLLPNDGQAHHLLAQAWLGASEWSNALKSAERAASLSPLPEVLLTLAEAHLRVAFSTMEEEKRFAAMQSAVDAGLRAGNLRVASAKTPVEKARELARLGTLEESAASYLQAGNTEENLLSTIRCYLLAGKWQDADRICNLAERAGSDKAVIGAYRALVLSSRAKTAEARAALERIEDAGKAETLVALARANIALREMKAPEALRILLSLQSRQEASEAVDVMLMTAYAEVRDFPRAEDHFRNALLRNPLDWRALAQKGYESLAVGSIRNAARYFDLAGRIRSDDAWVLCGQSLCAEDKRRAVELAQKAVRQSPADPWAWVVLSSAQWRAGQLDEALRSIQRAYNMDRDNYNIGSPPDVRRAGQIARILGRRPILPLK